jgi:hypothetical protein
MERNPQNLAISEIRSMIRNLVTEHGRDKMSIENKLNSIRSDITKLTETVLRMEKLIIDMKGKSTLPTSATTSERIADQYIALMGTAAHPYINQSLTK